MRRLIVLPTLAVSVLAGSAMTYAQRPRQTSAQLAASQPAKPIRDISDLESGMPLEYVLASLRKIYKLRNELPESDKPQKIEAWEVLSEDQFIGELVFEDGKLRMATKRIWSPAQGEIELVDRIFTSI